ncbi:hypothetical protein Ms3S1_26830 [Methylosinus sp. 3S-1]
MWFVHQLDPGGSDYNIPAAIRLKGDLDIEALHRSLIEIVRRHEILRTTYRMDKNTPVQYISDNPYIPMHIEDLRSQPTTNCFDIVRQRAFAQARQPFDLANGPVIRVQLLILPSVDATADHVLIIVFHHIVTDDWSSALFFNELATIYPAFASGRPSPLPEPELQYVDFAVAQRKWLDGDTLERHLAYWREKLAGGSPSIDLPTRRDGDAGLQKTGGEVHFEIAEKVKRQLTRLSEQSSYTRFVIFMSAFYVFLFRYTHQTDICVGAPIANRNLREVEDIQGFFVNTLVLRAKLSGDQRFSALLEQVQTLALEAQTHQDLPFERLVEALGPQIRTFGINPLFRVAFVFHNIGFEDPKIPGFDVEIVQGVRRNAVFDLVLHIAENEKGLRGWFEYDMGLFEDATVERMARHFQNLLESASSKSDSRISELSLLDETERHRLLVDWNDTAAAYPQDRCIHQLFEAQASETPDAVAVAFEEQSLTYAQLNARANRLAHHLRRLGVGPETLVGLCVERSLEMIVGPLGIMKAGGAYLPLDPDYPLERLAYMLADARPLAILTQERLRQRLPDDVETLSLDADWPSIAESRADNPDNLAHPQNLAYVIYTSGSTGKPKGVGVTHQNVRRLFAAAEEAFDFSCDDVWTLFHSFAFDFSVWEIWGALLYGGRLIIPSYWVTRSPEAFYDLLCSQSVTVLNQTPSSFYQLSIVDAARKGSELERFPIERNRSIDQNSLKRKNSRGLSDPIGSDSPLSSLRLVIFGGEALETGRLKEWFSRHGDKQPQLVNMYGITETTVHVTLGPLQRDSAGGVGRPLDDLQALILDRSSSLLPIGVSGELYIGGAGLARGYLGRADLTAERFVPNPFGEPGERLYRTGDLARYRADGNIEYLGRADHQVKIRGFRIELGEIEAALGRLETVREAAALAREDAPGDKRIVAYVVCEDGAEANVAQLRASLASDLPDYMIPSAFVFLDSLPLTQNGKIDRKALPEPDLDAQAARAYVAPRTPVEETLCLIWAEALGVERVGVDDNFFELGGHSLLAMTLIETMRRSDLQTDVRSLFSHPTPASLAAVIGHESAIVVPPNLIPPGCDAITPEMLPLARLTQAEIDRVVAAVPGGATNVQDIYPLAPLQEGILFHHLMAQKGDPYVLLVLLAFDTKTRLEGFCRALQSAIARHDILRTAVMWEGLAEPVQVVLREALLIAEEVPLDPAGDSARQLLERFDPRRFRLDVRQAPMIRLFWAFDPQSDRCIAAFFIHHLIDDATSLRLLGEEILAQLSGIGDRPRSPPYRNFVAQARLGVSPAEHEAFFTEMLGDVTEPTAPFGLSDVQGDGSNVEEARLDVDAALARRTRAAARSLGLSVASLWHLAFAQALARVSGRIDVVFGTVLFGRMHGGVGADRAIGLFINTLPIRVRVGRQSVADSARLVHDRLTRLLRHEHAPLALAQRCSGIAATIPLFSALLNYRHSAPETESAAAFEGVTELHAQERTNYPLTLSIDDFGNGFRLEAQTRHPLDPKIICGYLQTALEGLVTALETAPGTPVLTIDVLSEAERHRLLVDWNDTAAAYPQDRCIHQLFEAQASETPDAVAVAFEEQSLTYAQLNARANRLAHHLRRLGVGPETLVGLCVERSLEMIVGLLGIMKAGGAYLPLDPDYPADRLAFMLADARPLLILTQERLRQRLPKDAATLSLDVEADWPSIAESREDNPENLAHPQNLAYVIYTSGSTGKPKGVGVAHDGLVNRIDWMQKHYRLTDDDVVLQKTPFSFDVSVWEFFWPLLTGARLVLAAPGDHREPGRLAKLIESRAVTTLHFVPTMLTAFLNAVEGKRMRSLRRVICSGEELSDSAVSKFHEMAYRENMASCELHNLYGPTEASIDVTAYCCVDDGGIDRVPIGRPIANTKIYLLDKALQPVPIGVSGELYIGGVGLARGYLNRPDLTAERFVPSPFGAPGERLYRTGDLARYRRDGNIQYLGRADHQVKIRGFRIELGEIEAALGRLETVREAAALAREDESGDKRIVAYVVCEDGAEANVAQLRASLAKDLPDYMIPSAFVFLDSLPLTQNGKIDRKALPAPDAAASAARAYVAPRTPVEETLCLIWTEALGVERVGVDDNFFELGGHSLLAMTLIETMRRSDLRTDVRSLFSHPTPASLAAVVGHENAIVVPPNLIPPGCDAITPEMLPLARLTQAEIDRVVAAVPGGATNVQDIYPLAPLQEGILFHHLMAQKGDPYILPVLLAFDTKTRLEGFCRALQSAIARHDILRTAVMWEGLAEPVQVVLREASLIAEEVPLDPAGDSARQLLERFDPRRFRLDVRQAPMIRLFWAFDPQSDRWTLMLLAHHLIFDHSTLEVLLEEAAVRLSGRCDAWPSPIPYRNFVAQARLGVSRAEHEAFFTEMLGDVTEPTAPFGLSDVQGDGSNVEEARLDVDAALARRTRAAARSLGLSVASLWHLAFAQALARVSGRIDVVFGTVLFGRMHGGVGADRAIGLFINTLPIRVRVGQQSVADSARLVHDRLTRLLRHEHAPLALAQRCSGIAATIPLFSALLNYRHSAPETESAAAFEGVTELHAQERTNYPLTLSIDDFGNGFRLEAQTRHPLDPKIICGYLQTALEGLVTALETAPGTPVLTIDVLSEAERHRLLVDWNDTAAAYPQDRCIHQLFEAQASETPDAVAVAFEEQSLTYAQLNARANRLAHHLRRLGVGPETLVGLCVERSLEMIVGLLGIMKAGGAYLPLDPDYPLERLAYMLADARPLAILTQERLRQRLPDDVETLSLDADWPSIAESREHNPENLAHPQNLAYVIYTSGSTGKPKGVGVTHQNVRRLFAAAEEAFDFSCDDVWTLFHSFAFDFSVWEIWGALLYGGRLIIVPYWVSRSPEAFYELLRAQSVTVLNQTPSNFYNLDSVDSIHLAGLSSLKLVIFGGEALEVERLKGWFERHGHTRPRLCNMYGITETTVHVTRQLIRPDETEGVGRPLRDLQVYIRGSNLHLLPIGMSGELYIGGAGLARGYLNRPDLTAERFVPSPFGAPGERLYRTGDLARYHRDGNIQYLGRADHQVKIRGFRIELGEIEAALGRLETVREAAALAREDEPGDKRIIAYVVCEDGAEANVAQLRASLAKDLPDYMIPSAFVFLDSLPLTQNGKIDRKALPEPDLDAQAARAYVLPRTATEWLLLKEFKDILCRRSIGIDDNFFELGGHSLTAIKLIDRIRREIRGDLPTMAIFQAPTARRLAEMISGSREDDRSLIVPLCRGGENPPIYCIHPAGGSPIRYSAFADSLQGAAPVYGVQSRRIFDDRHIDASVEEMAECYIGQIREHQPHGPYFLLGWSSAGVTAAAMAEKLEAIGEDVAFIGIIDSMLDVESIGADVDPSDRPSIALESFRELALLEGKNPNDLLTDDDRKHLQDISARLTAEEQVRYAAIWGQDRGFWQGVSNELIDFLHADSKNAIRMVREHHIKKIHAPIHYWAARQSLTANAAPRSDWSRVTRGGLTFQIVDGDHDSIVVDPIVHEQIKDVLTAVWLEGAERKSARSR